MFNTLQLVPIKFALMLTKPDRRTTADDTTTRKRDLPCWAHKTLSCLSPKVKEVSIVNGLSEVKKCEEDKQNERNGGGKGKSYEQSSGNEYSGTRERLPTTGNKFKSISAQN